MDKKADGQALVLLLAIIVIAWMIFTFYTNFDFGASDAEKKIDDATESMHQNILMVNYLKTPVGSSTMAELLLEYNEDGSKEDMIKEETSKIIKAVYGDDADWNLNVGSKSISNDGDGAGNEIDVSEEIPKYDGSALKIRLRVD